MGFIDEVDSRVITLSLAMLADSVGNSFLIIVLPLFIASGTIEGGLLGMDELLITGVVLSMAGFISSIFQRFTGMLSDRTQKRKLFVLMGLALLSISGYAYSLTNTYTGVLFVRALQGFAGALIIPAGVALVSEYSTSATRGGSMGIYNTFRLIGFGAGPIAAGLVVQAGPYDLSFIGLSTAVSGFNAAFYFAAVTAAMSLVLVWVFVNDPEYDESPRRAVGLGFDVYSDEPGRRFTPEFTLGVATLFMAIGIALFATIQTKVNARLDQGATVFGIQFAAFIIAQVLFQTPVGRASDYFGRRPFIVLGMVLLIPSTLAQGLVWTSLQMFVVRFIQGAAGAMFFAPALALIGDISGEDAGSKLSMLTMGFGFGIAVGPMTSGYLIRYGFFAPFAFGGFLAFLGAVLVISEVEETLKDPSSLGFLL